MKIFLVILPFKNTSARKNDIGLMNYVKTTEYSRERTYSQGMYGAVSGHILPLEGIEGGEALTTFCLPCSKSVPASNQNGTLFDSCLGWSTTHLTLNIYTGVPQPVI